MIEKVIPYAVAFLGALLLTLVLTPLVREFNRRLGMVDKPDPRRINKVPIPRGGGVAIFLGVLAVFSALHAFWPLAATSRLFSIFVPFSVLAGLTVALGYADDKFSLPPKVKLLGQIVIAVLTWYWADLGFNDLWPAIPRWLDALLTVFWIVGAMNAFNLIDGLDGLASGLALIATVGMAGGLFFTGHTVETLFYFAFAGGLLGFLRYNYNPASVFLGDSGSMLIGFTISVLPLCSHVPNSFLVSVGVPLLAMGVPIFDTSLAIIRRTIRRFLVRGGTAQVAAGDSAAVMTADHDHLHHRILRSVGLSQRKAAWSLYALAAGLVVTGLVGVSLQSKAAGLWLAAVAVAVVVIFRDMARVELFDAGVLLQRAARVTASTTRRRLARLTVPFYLMCDLIALAAIYFFCCWALHYRMDAKVFRYGFLVRVVSVFAFLVFFRVYATVWSRAMLSNYLRLALACGFGAILGAVATYYYPHGFPGQLKVFTILYAALTYLAFVMIRTFRVFVRDLFYAIDCSRLLARTDVSRVLVYGTGLRYRAFRRELVRSTAANSRIIVGLIDDDIILRGHYIGGLRVMGSLLEAPAIIRKTRADAVVVACQIPEDWMKIVRETLAPTGVRISVFNFQET